MATKPTVSKLKKRADKSFSYYTRKRYADHRGFIKCCTCGSYRRWIEVDAGHYIPRGHNSVRYDERNVHPQCKQCNMNGGEPGAYTLFLIDKYGQDVIESLTSDGNKLKQFKCDELQEIITHYDREYKKL